MNYASNGIILSRRSLGEADRIITLLSKDFGKLTLLAKGARRLKSRKRGHLEVFNYIKFSAHKSRFLDLLLEVETLDSFAAIRADLKRVAVAYFLVEAVSRVTREEEKHPEVFSLLVNHLKKLKNTHNLKNLRWDFVLQLLTLLGFWPKGKKMGNPDRVLEEVSERKVTSIRVGKKLLT